MRGCSGPSHAALSADVFEQLRDHIVGGMLAPGASLPAERLLAETLGVNRAAVREGLKRLEQAGLVSIAQGEPTRVLDYRRTAGLELLGGLIVRADGRVDTKVARGVLELRTLLAPIVAGLAVDRASPETHEALRKVVARMRAEQGNLPELFRLSMEFWARMVEGTDNVAFELAFNSLASTYEGVLDQLTGVLAPEIEAIDDYEALVEAVACGARERAARTASAVVRRGAEAMENVFAALDAVQAVPCRPGGEP